MRRVIIIGASQGIGAEFARQYASRGYQCVLLARSKDKLEELASELRGKFGPLAAEAIAHDVTDFDGIPGLFEEILGKLGTLDVLIYNSGVMYTPVEGEFPTRDDLQTIDVNVKGAMCWLNCGASYFDKKADGTLVAIGSVAGDRGRAKMPSYHASKAALATFMESLWMRLSGKGVKVVTIKPGPIATAMAAGRGGGPKAYPVDQAVTEMIAAIDKGRRVAYVPWKWCIIMAIIRMIPGVIFRKLPI